MTHGNSNNFCHDAIEVRRTATFSAARFLHLQPCLEPVPEMKVAGTRASSNAPSRRSSRPRPRRASRPRRGAREANTLAVVTELLDYALTSRAPAREHDFQLDSARGRQRRTRGGRRRGPRRRFLCGKPGRSGTRPRGVAVARGGDSRALPEVPADRGGLESRTPNPRGRRGSFSNRVRHQASTVAIVFADGSRAFVDAAAEREVRTRRACTRRPRRGPRGRRCALPRLSRAAPSARPRRASTRMPARTSAPVLDVAARGSDGRRGARRRGARAERGAQREAPEPRRNHQSATCAEYTAVMTERQVGRERAAVARRRLEGRGGAPSPDVHGQRRAPARRRSESSRPAARRRRPRRRGTASRAASRARARCRTHHVDDDRVVPRHHGSDSGWSLRGPWSNREGAPRPETTLEQFRDVENDRLARRVRCCPVGCGARPARRRFCAPQQGPACGANFQWLALVPCCPNGWCSAPRRLRHRLRVQAQRRVRRRRDPSQALALGRRLIR